MPSPERGPRVEMPEAEVEVRPESVRPEEVRSTERGTPSPEGALVAPAYTPVAPPAQRTKDPTLKRVEEILEAGLAETYFSLPPAVRPKFKAKGEEVARAVQTMITSATLQAKKVVRLLVAWLRVIPHVNRFFLEQEAKIKTDRIVEYAEQERKKGV